MQRQQKRFLAKLIGSILSVIIVVTSYPPILSPQNNNIIYAQNINGIDVQGQNNTNIQAKNYGDYTYEEQSDGTIAITSYNGNDAKVEVPQTINGKEVTNLSSSLSGAFYGCKNIVEIKLPDTITSIGENAFSKCSSLKKINIPDNTSVIGWGAFQDCKDLTEIKIPDNVTEIGYYAFDGCSSLQEIKLPAHVSQLGDCIFQDCSNLLKIEIPGNITQMGYYVFKGCSQLREVKILSGIKSVGQGAFEDCGSLEKIEIPSSVTYISFYAFKNCSSLTKVTLPLSVTGINNHAFENCDKLREIIIPSSVQNMGDSVFSGCNNLVIKGFKDSFAEEYAKIHNILFMYINTISSADNIIVSYETENLEKPLFLNTILLKEDDLDYQKIDLLDKIAEEGISPEDVKFQVYDITLTDELQNIVQPKETATVKIPVPKEYQGENCKVYHVRNNGGMVNMNAEYSDNYLIFQTDHFSTYLITETELIEQNIIYGDINADGGVNSKDVVLLKKHLAGYEGLTFDTVAADVNVDGNVDSKDAVRLLRHLAGYEVELGK